MLLFSGHYCETDGLGSESGQCYGGYFCTAGSSVPNPTDGVTGDICPAGHYCPNGTTTPQACSKGYYSNSTGNTASTDCELCTPGNHMCKLCSTHMDQINNTDHCQ